MRCEVVSEPRLWTYCFRVLLRWVGIVDTGVVGEYSWSLMSVVLTLVPVVVVSWSLTIEVRDSSDCRSSSGWAN